jgi:hypothetical protein
MTDNEIIKALYDEIHLAEYTDSSYCNNVELNLITATLDLINRQKAEIERLQIEVSKLKKEMSYMINPNTIGDKYEMGCW